MTEESIDDMVLEDKVQEEWDRNTDTTVEDMAIDDSELTGAARVAARIKAVYPDVGVVELVDLLSIEKMASGSYSINGEAVKNIANQPIADIDTFLRKAGKKEDK